MKECELFEISGTKGPEDQIKVPDWFEALPVNEKIWNFHKMFFLIKLEKSPNFRAIRFMVSEIFTFEIRVRVQKDPKITAGLSMLKSI